MHYKNYVFVKLVPMKIFGLEQEKIQFHCKDQVNVLNMANGHLFLSKLLF